MTSLDENICKKLFDKLNGPIKSIIETYSPKCRSSTTGFLDEKTIDKKFNKPDLCSLTYELMNLLIGIKHDLSLLDSFKKDIKVIHKNHEENVNQLFQKFTQKIANESKNELTNQIGEAKVEITSLLSQNKQPNEKPKVMKKPISNEKQVLVVNIDENDIIETNDKVKKSKTYSDKLKENLSEKLKDVPVSKATLNREGQAILIFPTPESCSQAKNSLQTEFNVTNSVRKQKIIQPRLKIHNIDPKLSQIEKTELRNEIITKNTSLKNANESEFQITFIDKKDHFAIAKVSPNIYKTLINNGRIFISLSSHQVTEHFHAIQCFNCQKFGHTSSSPLCNEKDVAPKMTCLYCSEQHKSSQCPSKKIKKNHKCANCLASETHSIKNNANHTSSSKACPLYKKEIERLKSNTCYEQSVFLAYSKN